MEELNTTAAHPRKTAVQRMEERGLARGQAKMLLRMFAMRGFDLTDEMRKRVTLYADAAQLDAWADALVSAESVADVFAEK